MSFNIRPIGYFKELKHGLINGPCLNELLGKGDYAAHKSQLLSYLKSGFVYIASPGIGIDVIDNQRISGAIHALTDGKWMWPADLVYYVENYNVGLPDTFLNDLKSRGWSVPKDVDIGSLEVEI